MHNKSPYILHLSTIKTWGGGEQQLVALYQALAKRNIHQIIFCRADSALALYCEQHQLAYETYTKPMSFDLKFAWHIKKLCKLHPIDLIHIHDARSHTAALLAKILWKNKPQLIVSRKVNFPIPHRRLSFYKYNTPHINTIICISRAVRDRVAECVWDKEKLVIIRDSIDISRFNPKNQSRDLRSNLQFTDSAVLIGTAASLVASKDLFTFIDTAKQVIELGYPVKFIIMGDGPLKLKLQHYAKELEISEHVIFLGFRSDVANLLPQLDAFMLTSSEEGMGSVILEAMACEVPVIATAVGGIPECVIHEKTGLLAPSGDVKALGNALIRLLGDESLKTRLITEAHEHLSAFSVDKMADSTLAVYNQVLAAR